MGFSDLLNELLVPMGAGMEERMSEDRRLGLQERGFKRLAPLRRAQRAEEAGFQYGPEVGAQVETGEFPGVKPYEAATKRTEERRKSGAVLDVVSPTLRQRGVFPPEGPLPEAYYDAPPEALHWLLSETNPRKSMERAPTPTQIKQWAVTPGHPEQERSAFMLKEDERRKLREYEERVKATPIPQKIAENIGALESIQRTLRSGISAGDPKKTSQRIGTYLGPAYGSSGSAREYFNQMTGGRLMSPDEAKFRSAVSKVVDVLARKSEGAVLPEPMLRRLEKFHMNLSQSPEVFESQWRGFEQEVANLIAEEKRLSVTTRGDLARKALRQSPHQAFEAEDE